MLACAAKGLGHIWLDWKFDPEHVKLHEYFAFNNMTRNENNMLHKVFLLQRLETKKPHTIQAMCIHVEFK